MTPIAALSQFISLVIPVIAQQVHKWSSHDGRSGGDAWSRGITKADVDIATGDRPQSPHKNYAHPFTQQHLSKGQLVTWQQIDYILLFFTREVMNFIYFDGNQHTFWVWPCPLCLYSFRQYDYQRTARMFSLLSWNPE